MHKPFIIIKELDRGSGIGKPSRALSWDLATNKGGRMDHSGHSDASAGKGAEGKKATYDVKKNVGDKTMMHDDWEAVVLKEGAPNLCA